MAFCDLLHTFPNQVTLGSQHVFVILLWRLFMSPLSFPKCTNVDMSIINRPTSTLAFSMKSSVTVGIPCAPVYGLSCSYGRSLTTVSCSVKIHVSGRGRVHMGSPSSLLSPLRPPLWEPKATLLLLGRCLTPTPVRGGLGANCGGGLWF